MFFSNEINRLISKGMSNIERNWNFQNLPGKYRLQHIKSKGMWQSHASSRNKEAIDMWKVTHHPQSRCVVVCDDYSFQNTTVFFLLQWEVQTIIKLKLKQALKEF